MRWESVSVDPPKCGQYYVWSRTYGKCCMGFQGGSWGANKPDWWLENDTCPQQQIDGSFANR